jgi:hypothetical protein
MIFKNKKLNEEEKFMTKELDRAIKVIKGIEQAKIVDNGIISLSKFCEKNKEKIIGKQKVYKYMRDNDFLEYDEFKNNIPTKKSFNYNFMTLEKDIITSTKTGISKLRKSAYLTKSGQVYFLEVLNKENFN